MASADKESLCPNNRLKLLCSYGGKILPRPSDGQLKYVGGETRVLAVARSISFPELKKRIKEMFNIAEVVIKHQIMPEDLDLLVSVTCDEDLRHMLDEYDRHDSRCPSNSPRFRLFLFSSVPPRLAPFPDAAASSIEQRYLEAINGVSPSAGLSLFAIFTSAAISPTSNGPTPTSATLFSLPKQTTSPRPPAAARGYIGSRARRTWARGCIGSGARRTWAWRRGARWPTAWDHPTAATSSSSTPTTTTTITTTTGCRPSRRRTAAAAEGLGGRRVGPCGTWSVGADVVAGWHRLHRTW